MIEYLYTILLNYGQDYLKNIRIGSIVFLFLLIATSFLFSLGAVHAQPTQNSLVANNITNLKVEENKILPINLTANATGNLTKVPLNFSIVQKPKHGIVEIPIKYNGNRSVSIRYTPTYNYTGRDSFTFRATAIKASHTSNIGNVSLVVIPTIPFIANPGYRAVVAFVIALLIDFLIFLTAYAIIRARRQNKLINIRLKFWDIIRDDNWYPSLARFQLILWTGIVIFAYAGIALFRLFSGDGVPTSMPSNVLIVMGLSAGTAVTGSAISRFQYAGTTPTDVAPTKEIPSDKIRKKLPGFKTMLMENDKISLSRFQMFAWTWVGIVSYVALVFLQVNGNLYYFERLSLPDLPILLIVLMGIGQGTYLSAKSVKPSFVSINEIRCGEISLQAEKNFITILGSNFGTTGSVWLEYYSPVTAGEMQNCPSLSDIDLVEEWIKQYRYQRDRLECCYDITPKTTPTTPNLIRQDARIVVSLDDIIYKLKSKEKGVRVEKDILSPDATSDAEYVVRVEKDGLLTYANSDATLTITNIPPKAEGLSYSTEANKPVQIDIVHKGIQNLDTSKNYAITTSQPSKGGKVDIDQATGIATYTPKPDYAGPDPDSFTYKVNDGRSDSNTATVKISVTKTAG